MLKWLKSSGMPVMLFFLSFSSYISISLFFIYSSRDISLSAEASVNRNTVTADLDNGGKQPAIIVMTDDENPKKSLICQSVPNMQASTSHTVNMSEPAIPTPFKNDQQVCKKRKPGSGCPKGTGSKSTVAPEDRPHRLGRPPGTHYLQRAELPEKRSVGQMQLQLQPKPAVSGESRPFNLVCVFLTNLFFLHILIS